MVPCPSHAILILLGILQTYFTRHFFVLCHIVSLEYVLFYQDGKPQNMKSRLCNQWDQASKLSWFSRHLQITQKPGKCRNHHHTCARPLMIVQTHGGLVPSEVLSSRQWLPLPQTWSWLAEMKCSELLTAGRVHQQPWENRSGCPLTHGCWGGDLPRGSTLAFCNGTSVFKFV